MSSTSVARQNRRMRHKQLPVLLSPNTLEFPTKEAENLDISATGCSFINCDVTSQPIGKVFLEEERGFKVVDANDLNTKFTQNEPLKDELAIAVACKATRLFQNFSLFCHGMLAGMSFVLLLAHLITNEITKNFYFLLQPLHNVYNFMCVVCCISIFDRYDVGGEKNILKFLKKCCPSLIVIALYPICLLMSLSTVNVDEKLWMANSTDWQTLALKDSMNEFLYWKILNILKCSGALLAWILLCWNPNNNLFFSHLEAIHERNIQ